MESEPDSSSNVASTSELALESQGTGLSLGSLHPKMQLIVIPTSDCFWEDETRKPRGMCSVQGLGHFKCPVNVTY